MSDISGYKLIISATIIFISGLFIFTIIFRSYLMIKEIQLMISNGTINESNNLTITLLSAVPWGLGAVYVALIIAVIYYLLRGNKPEPPPIGSFRKY